MKTARILVAEPNTADQADYRRALPAEAFARTFVTNDDEARRHLREHSYDLFIAAVAPPDCDGLALLRAAKEQDAEMPVIVVAADLQAATEALRRGAADYLTKPLVEEELASAVGRLLHQRQLDAENVLLRRQIERPYRFDEFVAASPAMQKVFATIEQVSATNVDVLIVGETGTGKELVARSIHNRSNRREQPFVAVDCGAIPENLLESEFYGHERGAFTGADARRIGLLEFADGGTFFLDEVGELPALLQAKLLRTLQERRLRRVGGRDEIPVDVRVVAATARDLDAMIRENRFRDDLYYRINVVQIDLPPLRERGDDLGLLAEHFAFRYSREMGKPIVGISPEAYNVLSHYRWPGNVRELQNVMRRAIALTQHALITPDDLPDDLVESAGDVEDPCNADEGLGFFQLRQRCVAAFEQEYLTELLKRHQGNVRAAAAEAQLPRGTLYRLMKNHGIDGNAFR